MSATQKVIDAARSGYCNTSRDVADETGLPIKIASARVHELLVKGFLRRTNRKIFSHGRGDRRGKPYTVFEVAG